MVRTIIKRFTINFPQYTVDGIRRVSLLQKEANVHISSLCEMAQ